MPQATRSRPRRVSALALAAAALATALSGCADSRPARGVAEAAASEDPPTDAELRSTLLTGDDLPDGLYGSGEASHISLVVARDRDCDSLATLLSAGASTGAVRGLASSSWLGPENGVRTTVVMASFAPDTAERIVYEGLRALERCFTFTQRVASPAPDAIPAAWTEQEPQCVPVPKAGDVSVGLLLADDPTDADADAATGYVVVLVKDVLMVFSRHDPSGEAPGTPDPDLVTTQVDRVAAIRD